MSRDLHEDRWHQDGRTMAEAVAGVLARVCARALEHLPDLIAARPGTRLVLECRSLGMEPGMPCLDITMEIARRHDKEEPDA